MTKNEMQAELDRLRAENMALREIISATLDGTNLEIPAYADMQQHYDRISSHAAYAQGVLKRVLADEIAPATYHAELLRGRIAELSERYPYRHTAEAAAAV